MIEKIMMFITAVTLCAPSITAFAAASDWAKAPIEAAVASGWLSDDEFEGLYTEDITREEFCNIVYDADNALGRISANSATAEFTDTTNEKIFALSAMGIVKGKSGTEFAPNDSLTREEAAAILCRMGGFSEESEGAVPYDDDEEISDWAKGAVYKMQLKGVMIGVKDNLFAPKGRYTIEQAITSVSRLYDILPWSIDLTDENQVTHKTYHSSDGVSTVNGVYERDTDGSFKKTDGENTGHISELALSRNEFGITLKIMLIANHIFSDTELEETLWDVSTIRYDGEILSDNPDDANARMSICINDEYVKITGVRQGKGNNHEDFYFILDTDIERAAVNKITFNFNE